jgi:hypothetical protein
MPKATTQSIKPKLEFDIKAQRLSAKASQATCKKSSKSK